MTAPVCVPFVEEDFKEVRAGIRVFTRLFGLESDVSYSKYATREVDAIDTMDKMKQLMRESARFVGKQKHVSQQFDFIEDVKKDMFELLLVGEDDVSTAVNRKRCIPLYHLVVCPVIDMFRKYDHIGAIQRADSMLEYIKDTAFREEDYGVYDDGLVAREQLRQIVRDREEQNKVEVMARKKTSRKAAKQLEAEVKASEELMVE